LSYAEMRDHLEGEQFQKVGANGVEQAKIGQSQRLEASCDALFDFVSSNYEAIVAGNDNLLNLGFALNLLFNREGLVTPMTEKLDERYKTVYAPKLAAVQQDYMARNSERLIERQSRPVFENQKQYFANYTPYNFQQFSQLFSFRDYTRSQAAELQPLITAYKSNLVAQASEREKFKAQSDARWIELFLEKRIHEVLQRAAQPEKTETTRNANPPPVRPAQAVPPSPKPVQASAEVVTNVLHVRNYFRIPRESLTVANLSGLVVTAHRWSEGRLLLGLWFQGRFQDYALVSQSAVAILDPQNESWDIVQYPMASARDSTINNTFPTEALFGSRGSKRSANFQLFHGDFYLSDGGELKKFDFKTRQWATLSVPEHKDSQFFTVNGQLFAANEENIFEITDSGQSSHILASIRRRPTVSALDSLDNLGAPVLFAGPDRSLRVTVKDKIFAWNGNDWREELALNSSLPPEVLEDSTIFRAMSSFDGASLWMLHKNQSSPELCLIERTRPNPIITPGQKRKAEAQTASPLWKSLEGDSLVNAGAAAYQSNLYFYVDHSSSSDTNAYHAKLICLSRGIAEPIIVPLKFDTEHGRPPIASPSRGLGGTLSSGWMHFSENSLFIGHPNTPGVWTIPISEIETAVATQKQALLAKKQRLNNP